MSKHEDKPSGDRVAPGKSPVTPPLDSNYCTQKQVKGAMEEFFDTLLAPGSAFYDCQSERLACLARRAGVPPSEIEDVVSEVWLAAAKQREKFKSVAGLRAWLTRAVRYKVGDRLRRLNRTIRTESLNPDENPPLDHAESSRAKRKEARQKLAAILRKLRRKNPLDARLFRAHYLKGRELKELAEETGMTVDAIRNRLSRARKAARRGSHGETASRSL